MGASCNCNKGADSEELALTDVNHKLTANGEVMNMNNHSHNKSLSNEFSLKIEDDK
jgi:hypothetical protein